jgi:hypothetical protein
VREAHQEARDDRPERDARPEPAPAPVSVEPKTTVAHFEPSTTPAEGGGGRQSKPYVVWSSAPSSGGRSSHE